MVGVTISGADDPTEPSQLAELSREFPFVEWGILFSLSRAGTARYPSMDWVHDLCSSEFVRNAPGMKLSAHFCGQYTRDTIVGDSRWLLRPHMAQFRRVQLNGFQWPASPRFQDVLKLSPHEFILQVGDERALRQAGDKVAQWGVDRVSALYDPSAGQGIEALTWPEPPDVDGFRIGYAGGLSPGNVEEAIVTRVPLSVRDGCWIDMETGVRSGGYRADVDMFDLAKVREVLTRAKPFVRGA